MKKFKMLEKKAQRVKESVLRKEKEERGKLLFTGKRPFCSPAALPVTVRGAGGESRAPHHRTDCFTHLVSLA